MVLEPIRTAWGCVVTFVLIWLLSGTTTVQAEHFISSALDVALYLAKLALAGYILHFGCRVAYSAASTFISEIAYRAARRVVLEPIWTVSVVTSVLVGLLRGTTTVTPPPQLGPPTAHTAEPPGLAPPGPPTPCTPPIATEIDSLLSKPEIAAQIPKAVLAPRARHATARPAHRAYASEIDMIPQKPEIAVHISRTVHAPRARP